MQKRHSDSNLYFKEQSITTEKYVIPFIENNSNIVINENSRILEIGGGIGGNLVPFLEKRAHCTSVELLKDSHDKATLYLKESGYTNFNLINDDIYNVSKEDIGDFDVIFMKDVIEHIHDQIKFMEYVKQFLKPQGVFFLGFPVWQMPFGGHQQVCRGFISKVPWIHLLPEFIYKYILNNTNNQDKMEALLEIKETRLSIESFRKIIKKLDYKVLMETLYFINPNYEIKFNLKPIKLNKIIGNIPYVRNFFTTACYILLKK